MREARTLPPATRRTAYEETFDQGSGGWFAWKPGVAVPPEIRDGVFYTRSPWWVDPNHAPPGAGYLHLLAYLHTRADLVGDDGWPNRFVEEGHSRDLTDARLTVRMRGDVELRGAALTLLAQAELPHTTANYVLTGQPFAITPAWSEQTITLAPDPAQWVCLGAHEERADVYGCGDIGDVLRDVNVDLILVLFPLRIVPVGQVEDIHRLRTHRDYEVDYAHLPAGEVQFDTIRIEYP
jgi:hypothetical protein